MMKGRINLDYEPCPDPYNRHRALYLYLPEIESTMTIVQIRAVLIVQIEVTIHHGNSLNSITLLTLFLIYIYSGSWHDERRHQLGL